MSIPRSVCSAAAGMQAFANIPQEGSVTCDEVGTLVEVFSYAGHDARDIATWKSVNQWLLDDFNWFPVTYELETLQ